MSNAVLVTTACRLRGVCIVIVLKICSLLSVAARPSRHTTCGGEAPVPASADSAAAVLALASIAGKRKAGCVAVTVLLGVCVTHVFLKLG